MSSVINIKAFCVILSLAFVLLTNSVSAQCAMCSLNAENSTIEGNTQGNGLNDGILFLLAMPFLIGGAVAIIWYTQFRNTATKS